MDEDFLKILFTKLFRILESGGGGGRELSILIDK